MSKKILVCDDEFDFAKVVTNRLKSKGYEVVIAVDGVQSVAAAHREKPDLILLDIKMPAGGGRSAYENLQTSSDTMSIPVIIFSALPPSQVKEQAEQLGASDYITKPYEPEELLSKIKKLIG